MKAHRDARQNSEITTGFGPMLEDPCIDLAACSDVELLPMPFTTRRRQTDTSHDAGNESSQNTINTFDMSHRSSQHTYRIFWFWKWELAALTLAFGLVAAMFALLLSFNGQKTPDWGYSINLSTLLDLLAQMFCVAVGIVAAQVISQEKWTWFSGPEHRARPLHDLQEFDQGSRDSLGAVLLIPKVIRHNITVALAALVMVTSLAVGPFTQQAVQTKSCSYAVTDTNASLPYAHYVPRQKNYYMGHNGVVEMVGATGFQLKLAVFASLDGGAAAAENQITPSCSTGNCTFIGGDPIERSNINVAGKDSADLGETSGSFSTVAVCSSCLDVTPLVSFLGDRDDPDIISGYNRVSVYGLPNGLNITYGSYGTYVNISTVTNLDWVGDFLSPTHAVASGLAMVNMTFLSFSAAQCDEKVTPQCPIPGKTNLAGEYTLPNRSAGAIATTCALFPCIRSYLPGSITNNKLSESQIKSSKLWPTSDIYKDPQLMKPGNAMTLPIGYAGIQSPCRVGDVIYTTQNMSTAPNATVLWLYETMINGTVQATNTSAPEACIYRQEGLFVSAVSNLLQQKGTVFNTNCYIADTNVECEAGYIDVDGSNTWIEALYNSGNATVSSVEDYIESFAIAMTNKFRSIFGTSQYDPYGNTTLPLGEVQGIVWQDSVCTAARWGWLFLPVGLLLLTSSLLAVTMTRAWRLRQFQPVWKANLLPALLYKERFRDTNDQVASWPQGTTCADDANKSFTNTGEHLERLMDIDEIRKVTKDFMVRFEWNGLEHENAQYVGAQRGWLRRRKRSISASDVDSLLMDQ